MPTLFGSHAQELEILLARALRLGRLDPYELLETYVELLPANHREALDPRRLDVEALAASVGRLPHAFVTAPRVCVVRRLDVFTHTPVPSPTLAAGLLEDGTLLLESRSGLASVWGLAASLCTIAHELDKARALLPSAEEELLELSADDVGDPLVQIGGRRASLGRLALALGVDEASLRTADAATGGALLTVLGPSWEIPPIEIHPDLDLRSTTRRLEERTERIAAAVAEMGLAGRPLHVWVGPALVSDCLSPYARDLREPMLQWAATHADLVGTDLDLAEATSEDLLYALTADFVATDPRLLEERALADRTIGILRYTFDGVGFEAVDLGRVDPTMSNARLGGWRAQAMAPVLLRVEPDLEDGAGHGLTRLLHALAPSLASITLAFAATPLDTPTGALLVPSVALQWSGERAVALGGGQNLLEQELAGLSGDVRSHGAVLFVPDVTLLSTAHLRELRQRWHLQGIATAGAGEVTAVHEAVLTGLLKPEVDVRCGLVASRYLPSGRPVLATIAGFSALAVASLRRVLGSTGARSPGRRDRPRPSGPSRSVRLKA